MPIGARHAQSKAYTGTAAEFDDALSPGAQYVINATTDCWYKITTTSDAAVAAATDNILLNKGEQHPIISPDNSGTTTNSFVSVIRASADGTACIRLVEGV